MKTHYRSIFISDAHLCTRDCQWKRLDDFLHSVKCDNLYVIGDFFDFWQLKRRWFWPPEYNHLIRRILKMADHGTRVTFIPGNHDEAFREYVGHQFAGVRVELNAMHTTIGGAMFFVTHGDEFDSVVKYNKWLAQVGSVAYDYLLTINTFLNFFRRFFGLEYWSFAAYTKRKVKNARVYLDRYMAAVVAEGRRREVTGVICGHVHTPMIRMVDGLTYCNSGDWVDSCTALVETFDGRLQVIDDRHAVLFEGPFPRTLAS